MNRSISIHMAAAVLLGSGLFGQTRPADPGWPRTYTNGTAELIVYQPQVDAWTDFKSLKGRCAVALRPASKGDTRYGTFRFSAETLVDAGAKLVLLRDIQILDLQFAAASETASSQWSSAVRAMLPREAIVVSLDRLLAFVHAGDTPAATSHISNTPPPIYVSTDPAVLVILDGAPVMVDVESTGLRKVINTNWDLYWDRQTNRFYLHAAMQWLTAPSLEGSFTLASSIPAPLMHQFVVEQQAGPAPRVILADKPSELIAIQGAPRLSPVAGTQLSLVANTESDLFFHSGTHCYYFLTSGRWFRSAGLQGPWQYASAGLPEDFKRIPPDHLRAHVLASVPGTRAAEDAVLLASIPRTAQVSRTDAKAEVQYVGAPEFVPIAGTKLEYARNTPSDVLHAGGRYYLCLQGVWFVSASPTGPWRAADAIPQEIYSIPGSSPKYHVTYVRIMESTATTIVVGYTPGYFGAYVAGGVVVWGTGYYYPPFVSVGVVAAPVYWGSPCYTYGANVWYNPARGVYARGAAVYGPYGGFGAAAAYNPRSGTYTQGAGVWGPNGGIAAGRSYNPTTGTYSAGYQAANPYGSWGRGVAGNESNWVRGGYESNARGTVAAGETSKGGRGIAVEGINGKSGYAARTGDGDIYAGANGNVYKRDDGQWYRNQNGSWSQVDKNEARAQANQGAARDLGNMNSQRAESWRANGGLAGRGQGVEQRPRIQGRKR